MRSYSAAAGLLAAAALVPSGTDGRTAPDVPPFGEMAAKDFSPLDCNGEMNNGTFTGCVSWSSQNYDTAAAVTIPCGVCVDMDLPGDGTTNLHMQAGLDIQGALRFPLNWKGTIRTPFVFVQGHLFIDNDAKVDADNIDGFTFIIEGTFHQPFFPNAQNSESCRGMSCEVGKKPFVVAGGQLHVNALPDTCPTWVPILDVVRNENAVVATDYPKPPTPESGCTNLIIDSNFDTGYGPFYSGLGSEESINIGGSHDGSNSFKVKKRKKSWQGPFVDFVKSGLRDCIVANQTYLVEAKVKVSVEDPSSGKAYSNCHSNGTDCLGLTIHTANADGTPKLRWNNVRQIQSSNRHYDDTWFDFTAEVYFIDEVLADDSLYIMMYFGGPETGIAMEIDDVKMILPTPDLFPDPSKGSVCEDLVINGNAENAPPHKFPWNFIGNRDSSVTVMSETVNGTVNNFFGIRGRNATWASINVELINDCIVRHAQYTIKAKIRLDSLDEQDVRMVLKTWPVDPPPIPPFYKTESVGFGGISSCVGLSREKGWFECSRQFQFTEDHETATSIELSFMVPDDEASDIDIDNVSVVRSAAPLNQFVVSNSVASCWGAGATILQTSHTLSREDENVLTVESITDNGDSTATIRTTTPVAKPSSEADGSNYAVEMALLDRNVKIAPESDDSINPFHGAHFTIAYTPNVAQTLTGVHLSGMGQQGIFGRYPIHLQMNGNIEGSDISRNVVRGSNQRCYVVQGTHGVNLEHNIAHDTFGHCFMLEDGIEQNNTINYNLGSQTKATPEDGILSIAESDMFSATFWMSNPLNYLQGNIAAGSEDTGFWYEFLELVRGPSVRLDPDYDVNPSSFLFGHFKENRFHSNKGEGFKLYPNGYFPETRAIFKDNISVKNKGDGILLHNSRNLGVDGGFYGDNRMQIEVDKQADDITVTNALVVGFSDLYQMESEAGGLASHCPAHRPISGVQLHSFLRFRDSKGYHLENITFTNFEEGGFCIGTTAIEMDKQLRDGHFDAFATIKGLNFTTGAPMREKFDMCALSKQEYFIGDLAINDLDGSLHPDEASAVPGFIVSNSSFMNAFMEDGACQDMEGSCSLYCENACYRTLNFAVPVAFEYEDLVLEVVDDATGKSADFPGYFENKTKVKNNVDVEDVYENFVYQRRRYYSPIVPNGNYTLRFKRKDSNDDLWPMMTEMVWEDEPVCSPFIDDNTTTFVVPTPSAAECSNLVRNPGGEEGTYNHWMHSGGGIKMHPEGHTGSFAISSDGRTGAWQGPGQFIDIRCISGTDQKYEVTAKYKLINEADGSEVECDPNQQNVNAFNVCPRVSFRMRQLQGNTIGDAVEVKYAYPMAEAVAPFTSGSWNDLYGVFTVTETMAAADSIFMFIERAKPGVDIVVDDVLIQPTVQGCSNAIYNGDFELGDMRYWKTIGNSEIAISEPGHASAYALKTTRRDQFWSSMAHDINLDCLVEGEDYGIDGYIRLMDSNGAFVNCDSTLTWGVNSAMTNVCPSLDMRIVKGNITEDRHIGQVTQPWNSDSDAAPVWNQFNSIFKADATIVNADSVTIFFTRYEAKANIMIDDVSMKPIVPKDPAQLVSNGDGEAGNTNYILTKGSVLLDVTSPGYESNYSFVVSNRAKASDGISQTIDNTVLEAGVMYKLHAKLKLLMPSGVAYDCDPTANLGLKKCPGVSLRTQNPSEPAFTRPVATVQGEWLSGGWNSIEGFTTFTTSELMSKGLMYFIDGAAAGVDMVLDNIELRKLDITPSELGGGTATS
mmetsp:Transcript_16095/g.46404  ORF Transcript_16095/g.46404 Transcript_16095/m.46404 type:complete len:1765 (-) Transcript_16095:207-5501(-)